MNGFTESDIINYRYLIHGNAIKALQQILNACKELKISLKSKLEVGLNLMKHVDYRLGGNQLKRRVDADGAAGL